jgi:hypothetical protein
MRLILGLATNTLLFQTKMHRHIADLVLYITLQSPHPQYEFTAAFSFIASCIAV